MSTRVVDGVVTMPLEERNRASLGILQMCIAVLLFSLVDVLAKVLAKDYPINQIIFFRMLFGLIPAIILLRPHAAANSVLIISRPLAHLWRAATGLGAMGLTFYGTVALIARGRLYG